MPIVNEGELAALARLDEKNRAFASLVNDDVGPAFPTIKLAHYSLDHGLPLADEPHELGWGPAYEIEDGARLIFGDLSERR